MREPSEWEKIFANYAFNKGLIIGLIKDIYIYNPISMKDYIYITHTT